MNPITVVIAGAAVAIVPPLRRRVVPVVTAATVGAAEVVFVAGTVVRDVAVTAVRGERPV